MEDKNLEQQAKEISQVFTKLQQMDTIEDLNQEEAQQIEDYLNLIFEFLQLTISLKKQESCIEVCKMLLERNCVLDFSQIFGDDRISVIINQNLAACYEISWNNQKRIKYLNLTIKDLQIMIEQKICQQMTKTQISEILNLYKIYIHTLLQITAVYSNNEQNQIALDKSFQVLETVDIMFNIYEQLYQAIKHTFKISIKKTFDHFFKNFKFCMDFDDGFKLSAFKNKTNTLKFLEWKFNPENNKNFIKELVDENIDQQKFTTDWLSQFNIGDMMFINPLDLQSFNVCETGAFFKNEQFVVNLIIFFVLGCYCASTEKRHLALQEESVCLQTKGGAKSQRQFSNQTIQDYQFNSFLKNNQNYKESEYYHLKSIEILVKFLTESVLQNQMIQNYKQNYSNILHFITEEEEISVTYSHLINSSKKNQQKVKIDFKNQALEDLKKIGSDVNLRLTSKYPSQNVQNKQTNVSNLEESPNKDSKFDSKDKTQDKTQEKIEGKQKNQQNTIKKKKSKRTGNTKDQSQVLKSIQQQLELFNPKFFKTKFTKKDNKKIINQGIQKKLSQKNIQIISPNSEVNIQFCSPKVKHSTRNKIFSSQSKNVFFRTIVNKKDKGNQTLNKQKKTKQQKNKDVKKQTKKPSSNRKTKIKSSLQKIKINNNENEQIHHNKIKLDNLKNFVKNKIGKKHLNLQVISPRTPKDQDCTQLLQKFQTLNTNTHQRGALTCRNISQSKNLSIQKKLNSKKKLYPKHRTINFTTEIEQSMRSMQKNNRSA